MVATTMATTATLLRRAIMALTATPFPIEDTAIAITAALAVIGIIQIGAIEVRRQISAN